jgi:hypothetical protein
MYEVMLTLLLLTNSNPSYSIFTPRMIMYNSTYHLLNELD